MNIDPKHLRQTGIQMTTSSAEKSTSARKVTAGSGNAHSSDLQTGNTDSVSLTQAGTQLAQLVTHLTKHPVIDHQRTAEIQQRLASGTYQIDPARIADKLINQEFSSKP